MLLTALAAAAVIGQRLPTEPDCGGPWLYASACRQAAVLEQPFMCQVCRAWAALDRVVSAYQRNATNPSELSGGIFLYEAQAAQAIQLLQTVIDRRGAATVCETGFNAGHSALLFLALPNTTVVTFDTFERGYQRAALHYIRHDLGLRSRLRFSVGAEARRLGRGVGQLLGRAVPRLDGRAPRRGRRVSGDARRFGGRGVDDSRRLRLGVGPDAARLGPGGDGET